MITDNMIALDTLAMEKHLAKDLTHAIIETGNQNLKEAFKQLRNKTEQDHFDIYQISRQNGWYPEAARANNQEISQLNSFLQETFQLNLQQNQYQQQVRQPGQYYNQQGQNQMYQQNQQNHEKQQPAGSQMGNQVRRQVQGQTNNQYQNGNQQNKTIKPDQNTYQGSYYQRGDNR